MLPRSKMNVMEEFKLSTTSLPYFPVFLTEKYGLDLLVEYLFLFALPPNQPATLLDRMGDTFSKQPATPLYYSPIHSRKDLDNMAKFLQDALQNLVYKNDRQLHQDHCRGKIIRSGAAG
jgi:hypothetical protein